MLYILLGGCFMDSINMEIIKEAFSGAQSAGKSTRINAIDRLAKTGKFPVVVLPEFATVVAKMGYKLNKQSGIETQMKMSELQIEAELQAVNTLQHKFPEAPLGVIVCDRPVFDSYVYGKIGYEAGRISLPDLNKLEQLVWNHANANPYNKIYFCQPRTLYDGGDGMRLLGKEGESFQKLVHQYFVDFYKQNKHRINVEHIVK